MQQFVCVRIVKANAMDLSLFQFDYDLTFAAFMMNADRTIYGRFGTRSGRENTDDDLTIQAFQKALAGALKLHRGYPGNGSLLRGKQPVGGAFQTPEQYPSLRGQYGPDLDYAGSVARSCVHCHQVREAERLWYRADRKPIPDPVLFPYPQPDVVGLRLDPAEVARVAAVVPQSAAARAGFQPGDDIVGLNGQSMLSIADIQWVLHQAGDDAPLLALVDRDGKRVRLTLRLDKGWRRADDLSWRATTWDLRRMATGGLVLEDLSAGERNRLGLPPEALALQVKYVGQFGEHAVGKQAGFEKADVIVEVDGRRDRLSESQWMAYALQQNSPGAVVSVVVLRNGERLPRKLSLR